MASSPLQKGDNNRKRCKFPKKCARHDSSKRLSGPAARQSYRILHMLPDLQMGGGQQLVLRLIGAMDHKRFRNFLCYVNPIRDLEPLCQGMGIQHMCLDRPPASVRQALTRLVRLIRHERIDLIHTNYTQADRFFGQFAAIWCGVPSVDTLHGTYCGNGHDPWAQAPISLAAARRKTYAAMRALASGTLAAKLSARTRAACKRRRARFAIKHVIAVSETALRSWAWYCKAIRVDDERITIIPNGIPLDEFDREYEKGEIESLRRILGLTDSDEVLINVGRLVSEKGQKWLIPMMQRVAEKRPNARLVIAGEGAEREELERAIRRAKLGGHIMLLGRHEDIPALLAMSDVFVFPSYREGHPLAVLEALAAAKPVVGFRIEAMVGVVADGVNGYTVGLEDAKGMADAVVRLLDDPGRAREMGLNGRRLVTEKYDIGRCVRALEDVYTAVLENTRGRAGTR